MKVLAGEDEFLASYDPRSYEPVAVTVDVVTLTIRDGALSVLPAQRGSSHGLPHPALPRPGRGEMVR